MDYTIIPTPLTLGASAVVIRTKHDDLFKLQLTRVNGDDKSLHVTLARVGNGGVIDMDLIHDVGIELSECGMAENRLKAWAWAADTLRQLAEAATSRVAILKTAKKVPTDFFIKYGMGAEKAQKIRAELLAKRGHPALRLHPKPKPKSKKRKRT